MHRWIARFMVLIILFLPIKSFAQVNQSALPTTSQQGDFCQPSKVHVKIKLKNGDTIRGNTIEINNREVKLCHEGVVQTIPRDNIKEIKSRQTAQQRLNHIGRVLGIIGVAIFAFGFIVSRNVGDYR